MTTITSQKRNSLGSRLRLAGMALLMTIIFPAAAQAQLGIVPADLQLQSGTIYHTDGNGHTIPPVYAVNPETLLAQRGSPLSGYTWSLANGSTYPPGTTVDALTGVFHGSGSPLVSGNYNFTMTVSDGSTTANGTFTFSVTDDYSSPPASSPCEQLYLPTYALANAQVGAGYGASLYADGGTPPYKSWHLAGGALPPGLVIDATRGVVRGTPNSGTGGTTYSFQISLVDSTGTTANNFDNLTYTITVNSGNTPIDPFNGVSLGGGWYYSSWFGYYNLNSYPWIYHLNLGWIYVSTSDNTNLYLYVLNGNSAPMGWLYTKQSPYIYSFAKSAWLYYDLSGTYFYNFSTRAWESQ